MGRWKRVLAAVAAGVIFAVSVPWTVSVVEALETGTYGDLTYMVLEDGTVAITDCDESVKEVKIPAEIDGMAVTGIGWRTFFGCKSLTTVIIPDSVTSIGYMAFYHTSLTEITIPDNVTSIEDYAFSGCTGLTEIIIPDSVTSIGSNAFSACTNLTEIIVSAYNTAFCSENGILFNLDQTELLCYPVGKTDDTYVIPDSVTSIGDYAFFECDSLTGITIPDGVTSIGRGAFSGCNSLPGITIPDSVTSIEDYAFSGCNSLTSITIPNGVTSIETNTFFGCTSLIEITIPESVTSIGNYAFSSCDRLTDVYYSGTEEAWNAIEIGESNESLLNATIHFNSIEETTTTTTTTTTETTTETTTTTESTATETSTTEETTTTAETTTEATTTTETTTDTIELPQSAGDIDGDNIIDANDAYYCLLAYAKLSVGSDSGLTDAQIQAADVDGNGTVDANDAYYILLYYAKHSVGQNVSWAELLG